MGRCRGRNGKSRCRGNATSHRAKFCKRCFLKRASSSGRTSQGNVAGNPGNRGNANAAGKLDNEGNGKIGCQKRAAGRRSWLKRQTSDVLIIKGSWLELILKGKKVWEIRGTKTKKRGIIHLARSGAGKLIFGSASLVSCFEISREAFKRNMKKHRISDFREVKYPKMHAWVLRNVRRYDKPLRYRHPRGAMIWVKAHKWFVGGGCS